MNIIILTEEDRIHNNIFRVSDSRFIHVQNILKSEINDKLEIGLLNGPLGEAKIEAISDNSVTLSVLEYKGHQNETLNLELICALPRPQTLKKILNICGTMGVENLYLIRTEKVEKSYFHSPLLNPDNYNKFLIEGLSQGRRTKLPKVSIYTRFKEFIEKGLQPTAEKSALLIADQGANNYLSNYDLMNKTEIKLAIGPEGGWNEFELNLFKEKGFKKIKLSSNTLRVENAAAAAIAQIELLINR